MLCKYANTFVSFSGLCISFAFVIASYGIQQFKHKCYIILKKQKQKKKQN